MSKPKKHESEERMDDAGVAGAETTGTPAGSSAAESADEALKATVAALAASQKAVNEGATRVAALEAEVSSLKDQYLRKLADYENFRKRMFREKEDSVKYANTQILNDLVTIVDDFDRAVQSSELSRDFNSLHNGVDMIRKTLLGVLESKYGLERFDSLGTVFDPNMHEAVMSEQGACDEPCVVEEYVKGYRLRDRILRSAKVKVRMPLSDGPADEETNEAKA